jgi:cytolysin (calcineurin-like family phosphatase)
MADVELCTDSVLGPYLIACDRTAAELAERFGSAGVSFEREHPAAQTADDAGQCIIYLGVGADLAAISQLLNDAGYHWELCGL